MALPTPPVDMVLLPRKLQVNIEGGLAVGKQGEVKRVAGRGPSLQPLTPVPVAANGRPALRTTGVVMAIHQVLTVTTIHGRLVGSMLAIMRQVETTMKSMGEATTEGMEEATMKNM